MPGFKILLNGRPRLDVSTEGLMILSVRVHGDTKGPDFSSIDVNGGNYEEGENNTHLIWINEAHINPEDEIDVEFIDDISTSFPGKTIDEIYSKEPERHGPWQPLEQMYKDLEKTPNLRNIFLLKLTTPSGEQIEAATSHDDFAYGFTVVWNWTRPDSAKVWLTSNSLKNIEAGLNGTEHARFKLSLGEKVVFRVST